MRISLFLIAILPMVTPASSLRCYVTNQPQSNSGVSSTSIQHHSISSGNSISISSSSSSSSSSSTSQSGGNFEGTLTECAKTENVCVEQFFEDDEDYKITFVRWCDVKANLRAQSIPTDGCTKGDELQLLQNPTTDDPNDKVRSYACSCNYDGCNNNEPPYEKFTIGKAIIGVGVIALIIIAIVIIVAICISCFCCQCCPLYRGSPVVHQTSPVVYQV